MPVKENKEGCDVGHLGWLFTWGKKNTVENIKYFHGHNSGARPLVLKLVISCVNISQSLLGN